MLRGSGVTFCAWDSDVARRGAGGSSFQERPQPLSATTIIIPHPRMLRSFA